MPRADSARGRATICWSAFSSASPLHDSAVIIQEDIAAAACFLPLTMNPKLSKELGSAIAPRLG
jgi:diadenylate cyclase